VVVSRLALHWADQIAPVLGKAHRALVAGGRLVFSVEHPITTAAPEADGPHVVVDRYFVPGRRELAWLGERISQPHHTLTDWFGALRTAGFAVEDLREGAPRRELVDDATFARRSRVPRFLVIAAGSR
jgi:SAM-dependent methyltransferase